MFLFSVVGVGVVFWPLAAEISKKATFKKIKDFLGGKSDFCTIDY